MLDPTHPDTKAALFLDFDGTLAALAPEPGAVQLDAALPGLLHELSDFLGGALAIVSGRSLEQIDQYFQPFRFSAAGVHGAERRGADGFVRRFALTGLDEVADRLAAFCARHPGLLLERKPGALALHYRQAEALESECLAVMNEALQGTQGMALLRGKKVVEMKPRRASKGLAITAFLDEPPFRNRRPWFLGDDVTDEVGFEVVQSRNGVAVKVGPGDTMAAHGLADTHAVRAWLKTTHVQLSNARRSDPARVSGPEARPVTALSSGTQ